MAITGIYYIDTTSFSTATSVWVGTLNPTKAPDGYYVFNGEYRQQVNGLLQNIRSCSSSPLCQFQPLNITNRYWTSIAVNSTGDLYGTAYNGSNNGAQVQIYKRTGNAGDLISLNQTLRTYRGITAAPNGDIYACNPTYTYYPGDIYKQTGGTGNFVSLNQSNRYWQGITVAPDGDVYASAVAGGIYKQTGGTGNFINIFSSNLGWYAMTSSPNGDIYAIQDEFGDGQIYKQTGGTGNFTSLGQEVASWTGIAAAPNGDIYACRYEGDIYKQTNGIGNFVALNQTSRRWYAMAVSPNGTVYAATLGGDIYYCSS